MTTQPEALRLADELDADSNIIGYDKHAAELRRLHAEVEELRGALDEAMWHVKYKELKAVNESDTALLRAENDKLRLANEAFGKRQEWWSDKMVALEQEVEALRADAERYRWLRENSTEYSLTQKDGYGGRELMGWEALDAAIDSARRKT